MLNHFSRVVLALAFVTLSGCFIGGGFGWGGRGDDHGGGRDDHGHDQHQQYDHDSRGGQNDDHRDGRY